MKWLTYGLLAAGCLLGFSGCQQSGCTSLMETCASRQNGNAGNWSTTPKSGGSSTTGKCDKYSYYFFCAASLQPVVQQWYPKCRLPVVRLCYSNGQPVKGEKFCIVTHEDTWTGWEVPPYAVTDNCDQ